MTYLYNIYFICKVRFITGRNVSIRFERGCSKKKNVLKLFVVEKKSRNRAHRTNIKNCNYKNKKKTTSRPVSTAIYIVVYYLLQKSKNT